MRSFPAFVREHAIPFAPQRGAEADIEKLAVFDAALAKSRVVFLGEQNHFVHEKYAYRLWFLRYLFSRGFRNLGEELSWADGVQVDRYLETGDASALERIATYGYLGAWRTDRDDSPTGYLRQSWDAYPNEAFAAEQLRFAHALRALSEERASGSRLRFFGFDVDAVPGVAYEQLEAWLSRHPTAPAVTELNRALARVPGESLEDEIARLDVGVACIAKHEDTLRPLLGEARGSFDDVKRSLTTLRDGFRYIREAHAAPDLDALHAPMAFRESAMHAHVEHVLSRLAPDEKLVLMAANDHLTRNAGGIRRHTSGVGPGGGLVPTVGTFVARRQQRPVFAIWFLYERGRASQPFAALGNDLRSPRKSLNHQLGAAGSAFVLATGSNDPRAAPLRKEAEIVSMYNTTYRATPAEQVDAICFIRNVNPLRD